MFRFLSAMSGFAMLGVVAATAQPVPPAKPPLNSRATGLPTESVTVNGMRQLPDAVIDNFVESVTSPSRAGKLTRWNKGVCPETIGLPPKLAAYVSWRVRDIATQVGAPVDSDKSCKTNIRIIFIDQPQALLDGVRKEKPAYLGYYDSEAQADTLAKVTRSIQSWYITQTQDVHGALHFDSHNSGGTSRDSHFLHIARHAYSLTDY